VTHEHTETPDPIFDEEIDFRPAFTLPAEIVVLGHRYHFRVEEDPERTLGRGDTGHALGLTDLNRGKIIIRGGGEQAEDAARDTMLHEVIHVVNFLLQLDMDEATVGRLSTGLLDTLRRNPELVAAIISR
jgi:hypothetical protein